MKNMTLGKSAFKGLAILLTCSTFSLTAQAETYYASQSAEGAVRINPAPIDRKTADYSKLTIITSSDLPESLKDKIYNRPVQMRKVEPRDLIPAPSSGYSYSDSLVSQKIHGLKSNLSSLQMNIENLAQNLSHIESKSDAWAADYYASIATINTRLQSGTTPGNPRLISELSMAENKLDSLTNTLQNLNLLSTKANELSSQSAFLLEETRAAYGISGAVEEDHANLARLEDSIANTTVAIERILNNT
ncbi:MAG: hypothetical protein KTR28_02240, partial [Micavibrio sp.]|nr:hypothetical protein [Micavibrio sp.]